MYAVAEPGSLEDLAHQDAIRDEFEELDIVQQLREDSDYVEWEAYSNFSEEEKRKRLTSGSLNGARGFSAQVSYCC